jgi:epoxyqueuosine reductase
MMGVTGEERSMSDRVRELHDGARLLEWAMIRGCSVAWGPAVEVVAARRTVLSLLDSRELDRDFFHDLLTRITDNAEDLPAWARTVIAVAVPAPAATVSFAAPGGHLTALLPPTYVRYRQTTDETAADLTANALGAACRTELVRGPEKTLAVRLGLASWGRNNITYTPTLGSYQQLVCVVTDAVLDPARRLGSASAASLPECAGCSSCAAACPTGAIVEDRFLIHAERCLVTFNERSGPWPEWLSPRAHACLIGCMACQESCPVNIGLLRVDDTDVSFSEDEASALLREEPGTTAPWPAIREKLASIGRLGDLPILGRNLRALLTDRV